MEGRGGEEGEVGGLWSIGEGKEKGRGRGREKGKGEWEKGRKRKEAALAMTACAFSGPRESHISAACVFGLQLSFPWEGLLPYNNSWVDRSPEQTRADTRRFASRGVMRTVELVHMPEWNPGAQKNLKVEFRASPVPDLQNFEARNMADFSSLRQVRVLKVGAFDPSRFFSRTLRPHVMSITKVCSRTVHEAPLTNNFYFSLLNTV